MIKWRSRETRNNLFSAVENGDTIIVYDLETTGLNPAKDKVIQFSAIKFCFENGEEKEIARFDTYVNPEVPLSPKITEITGITDDMLFDKPTEQEIFPEISQFFGSSFVASGYNVIKFDNKFMENMYQRQGSVFSPKFTVDVIEAAKDNVESGITENFKLGTIAQLYGVDKGLTFHNAMDDVIATKNLLIVFNDEYRASYEQDEGIIKDEITNEKVLSDKKQISEVSSITFWKGYRGFSRIYIVTDIGDFYYDIRNKIWGVSSKNNPYSIDEVDMDIVKQKTFEKCGANSEDDLVKIYYPKKSERVHIGEVQTLRYWCKETDTKSFHRIYITTDVGKFFYDIDKDTWNIGNENPGINVDLGELKQKCFEKLNVADEKEFAQKCQ